MENEKAVMSDEEMMASVEILRKRMASVRNGGKLIPAEEVFAKIAEKFNIDFCADE